MKDVILLGDRILVQPDAIEKKLGSTDLVKTDAMIANELPFTGEVKLVSDLCKDVRVGDKILFNKHAGIETEVQGEKLLIMTEGAVWLINERA